VEHLYVKLDDPSGLWYLRYRADKHANTQTPVNTLPPATAVGVGMYEY